MAANDFSVSGKSNECSSASARSNSFCACGLHEVLNSTLPKPSFLACASSSASAPKVANPNKDATSEAISLGFIGRSPSLKTKSVYAATREFYKTTQLSQNRWKFKRVTGIMEIEDKEKPRLEAKTLGRYRILGKLGRGAMGAVFRAIDPLIEREVALKTLLPELP